MAKTRKSKQKVPAHRFIRLDLSAAAGEDFHYIDLARELSAINSRLYRQGMMYHVANISIHDSQSSYLKFCTLPNTWPMRNAWKTAFAMWLEMNRVQLTPAALANAAKAAKYSDFRVHFNNTHRSDSDTPRFTDVEGELIRQDEYEYSTFFSTDGGSVDEFGIHMMGEHTGAPGSYTSVSAILAYNEIVSRKTAPIENADFDDGVWNNLIEVHGVNDDISQALSDDYDAPPYSNTVFPGAVVGVVENCPNGWSAREIHLKGDAQNSAMVGGFEVPCGLIKVETKCDDANTIGLIIELAPGPYKGIRAEAMGTPKLVDGKTWRVN